MDQLLSSIQQQMSLSSNNNEGTQINNDDTKTLLQKQQETQQKINRLIEQSAQVAICGPACQKQKVSTELKQRYLNAKTNVETAPIKLEEAKKNYYTYTQGSAYYDQKKEKELVQKAKQISDVLKETFNDELTNAKTMNNYLNTALTNSLSTEELYNEYLYNNEILEKKIRNTHGDILTNDRKTYYETDALDRLKLWYKFLWYIYYLLVIILILASIFSPSVYSLSIKILIILLFFFYPYYITYITSSIYHFITFIINKTPKNVYNNL